MHINYFFVYWNIAPDKPYSQPVEYYYMLAFSALSRAFPRYWPKCLGHRFWF